MICYFLDKEAYDLLNEWVEENRSKTIYAPYYSKKNSLKLTDKDYSNFEMLVEATLYGYKFSLLKKKQIAKGKLTVCSTEKNDFTISFDLINESELSEKDKVFLSHTITVFLTAFVSANSFMWFGNLSENKRIIARSSNTRNRKNITFRKFKESLYAVEFRPHKSPEGVFSVRGHFRRYSNGKIIWIDEYLKGKNK